MTSTNAPIVSLIYQTGCPACQAAKVEFKKLEARNPQLRYRLLDIDKINSPFPITGTPTFCVHLAGGYYKTDPSVMGVDAVTAEALEDWLRTSFAHYTAHRPMIRR